MHERIKGVIWLAEIMALAWLTVVALVAVPAAPWPDALGLAVVGAGAAVALVCVWRLGPE